MGAFSKYFKPLLLWKLQTHTQTGMSTNCDTYVTHSSLTAVSSELIFVHLYLTFCPKPHGQFFNEISKSTSLSTINILTYIPPKRLLKP